MRMIHTNRITRVMAFTLVAAVAFFGVYRAEQAAYKSCVATQHLWDTADSISATLTRHTEAAPGASQQTITQIAKNNAQRDTELAELRAVNGERPSC